MTETIAEQHKNAIGASQAATVLGYGRYGNTPYTIFREKIGAAEPEDRSIDREYTLNRGNAMEELIAKEFTRRTAIKVRRHFHSKAKAHKEHPFIICHPDYKIEGMSAVLEIKTSSNLREMSEWQLKAAPEDCNETFPIQHYIQMAVQCACLGYNTAFIAADIVGRFVHFGPVHYDQKFLDEQIIAPLAKWWNAYVVTKTAPPPSNVQEVAQIYRAVAGETLVADENLLNLCVTHSEAKATESAAQKERKNAEKKITELMQNAEILLDEGGNKLATYKEQKGRNFIDGKRLQVELPQIYEQYSRTMKPSRVFRNAIQTKAGGK